MHNRNAMVYPLVGWFLLPDTNFVESWLSEKSAGGGERPFPRGFGRRKNGTAQVTRCLQSDMFRPQIVGKNDFTTVDPRADSLISTNLTEVPLNCNSG